MKLARILFSLAAMIAVSACATPFQVAEVRDVLDAPSPTVGTPFSKALFDEYKEATRHEALDEYEWRHAHGFAVKAAKAATGEEPPPENPADWDIPAPLKPDLAAAHQALTEDFALGARQRLPAESAKAQVSLDCWIEEAAEGETNPACRQVFAVTEPKLKPPAPPPPAPVAEPAPPPSPAQPLVVTFAFGRADISASAMQNLHEAASALKAAKPATIRVHGFTDSVGSPKANKALSERRAKAVADQLAKLGVTGMTVEITGFGLDRPAVPTKPNVKGPRNRRAEVTWESRR
ncbi:OmpA family protein [Magnetospirillum sp. SS-4]|uniref:OmpA family protein n=1 Tax=Magnetospirillum sp. SS-4 TaxID=2681465 RepID=UPI001385A8FC|nr:OmpA family protein [Magnetospirillum sp. SS-4]CAA7613824.1 Outer membrane protein [Magnetospirillum sp. SS-4]